MWLVAGLLGLAAVATGLLPAAAAGDVTLRALPVLAFLVAASLLAALADAVGTFDAAGAGCARLARGRALRLWCLVAVLAVGVTVTLGLDTTAVLVTPVVLAIADQAGVGAVPLALLVVWLANTASLLLPVSNLTTLLAFDRLGLTPLAYAHRLLLPEVAAVAVTLLVLGIRDRRSLRGRFRLAPAPVPRDRVMLAAGALACAGLAAGALAGARPWVAAAVSATLLGGACAVRAPDLLRRAGVPWRLVVLTEGLFLVVEALGRHGLDARLDALAGSGGVRTAATGAVLANAVDNLPAYLALERVVTPGDLPALLVGVNAGPLVLLWGSLATLLWRERCRARGVHIGAWEFARTGLVGVPLVVLAAVGALALG